MIRATKTQQEIEKQKIIDDCVFSWSRQPGETPAAYQAFDLYLMLGKARKVTTVMDLTQTSYKTLMSWTKKYQWKKRSKDYDVMKTEEMRVKLEEEVMVHRVRQLHIGKGLQELASKGSEMLMENVEDLSAQDISKLADIGTKLVNLAIGSPTERTESKVESKVTIEVEEIDPEIAAEIGKMMAIKRSENMEINV